MIERPMKPAELAAVVLMSIVVIVVIVVVSVPLTIHYWNVVAEWWGS